MSTDDRGREPADLPDVWRVEVHGGPGDERVAVAEVGIRETHGYQWERFEDFLDRLRARGATTPAHGTGAVPTPHDGESCEFADRENAALQARLSGLLDTPSAPAVVHDPDTEDEDGRCAEYPDLIDCHGARWVWAFGSEYRARHVLGGWKCRDVGYIRGVFGPVTEVPAAAPEGGPGSDRPWTSREVGDRNAADRMETWLREDKPSRVLDQWTEDLERLIVAARHGRRQPAPTEGDLTEAMPRAGLCGEQYRTGDSVWLCTEPTGHRKGGCVDGEPPSLGEGAGETGDDPPDLIDGLGHRWWPSGIRNGRRYYMPWDRSAFDAAGALHRYQLVQPVREVRRDEWMVTAMGAEEAGDWVALRSKLDEWLTEDGISPYRRTAFVQVLEWLDAHDTRDGER